MASSEALFPMPELGSRDEDEEGQALGESKGKGKRLGAKGPGKDEDAHNVQANAPASSIPRASQIQKTHTRFPFLAARVKEKWFGKGCTPVDKVNSSELDKRNAVKNIPVYEPKAPRLQDAGMEA